MHLRHQFLLPEPTLLVISHLVIIVGHANCPTMKRDVSYLQRQLTFLLENKRRKLSNNRMMDHSSNIVSLSEDFFEPQVFETCNEKEVSPKQLFHLSSEKMDACKADMLHVNKVVPGSQMAIHNIEHAESKAAAMVAEITKTYERRNKVPTTPHAAQPHVTTKHATQPNVLRRNDPLKEDPLLMHNSNLCSVNELNKINNLVPFKELILLLGQKEAVSCFFNLGSTIDPSEERPHIYLSTNKNGERLGKKNPNDPPPFYTMLLVNGLCLHNCMVDSGASNNVMSLEVMNELGLTISRPYKNLQVMDSREVQVLGIIQNLEVRLQAYPDRIFIMDVVVVDCPAKWGMLLSRKWAADVGGMMRMDLAFVDMPVAAIYLVRIYQERKMSRNVVDPKTI